MENQKPEALRLAEWCEENSPSIYRQSAETAKELRRQHARIQELEARLQKLQSDYDAVVAGGVSAQRVAQGKDHFAQDSKMVAAPVVLPEPVAAQTRLVGGSTNWTTVSLFHAKSLTGGAYELRYLHTEQQVRELLARDLGGVNLDRLDKALIKLGYATWVSQEEAAANIPHWVNALTRCVLETPVAAPQPQADARDAAEPDTTRLNFMLHTNAAVHSVALGWALKFGDCHWQEGTYGTAREAIDAAIAAAKGE